MVVAALKNLPKEWNGVVVMDWSDGLKTLPKALCSLLDILINMEHHRHKMPHDLEDDYAHNTNDLR